MLSVATPGSPDASGYSANLPPRRWASALAGSKGPKKILIYLSASLFALLGMSPDIPVACCTQLHSNTTDSGEISGLHLTFRVAPSIAAPHPDSWGAMRRGLRIPLSRQTFENYTVVASALVAESRQTRPAQTRVPNPGVQVQILPSALGGCRASVTEVEDVPDSDSGALEGRAGSTPAGRTEHCGSLVKSRITLGFYP
jgi:hypothetical protein